MRTLYIPFLRLSSHQVARNQRSSSIDPILPESDDTSVLSVIPPPELHLMLGIFNHLFKAFKASWPLAAEWPKLLNIKPVAYHGGESFHGPSCKKTPQKH
jgi:hypothetical protein